MKHVKSQYEKFVFPHTLSQGDLILVYDQANDALRVEKFEPLWNGTYIVKWVLKKGAYEILDYEGNILPKPRNELYLKSYYAWNFMPSDTFCIICTYSFARCAFVCFYLHIAWSILSALLKNIPYFAW